MKIKSFSTDHPETKSDEIYLGNYTSEEASIIGWTYKRKGITALCRDGSLYPYAKSYNVYPYFAKRSEMEEAGIDFNDSEK